MECFPVYHDELDNADPATMPQACGAEATEEFWKTLRPEDRWIISKVNTLAKDMTENMDKFELGIAVQKVHDFIWDEFCDWYIEIVKTTHVRVGE